MLTPAFNFKTTWYELTAWQFTFSSDWLMENKYQHKKLIKKHQLHGSYMAQCEPGLPIFPDPNPAQIDQDNIYYTTLLLLPHSAISTFTTEP